jgi:hypothetical protein
MDMSHRLIRTAATTAMAAAILGGTVPATAAPPTVERIPIDETFPDDELTEACGFVVTTTAHGSVTTRTFDGEGTGPVELTTINVGLTATADGQTFRFRDVGADLIRVTPDGTAVLQIIGQVPFGFAGVLRIDLETGEAILEPQDRSEAQLAKACGVLTG